MQGDTPCHRVTVAEMNEEHLANWLETLRLRRLKARREFQEMQEKKAQLKHERNVKEYEHQMRMLTKEIEGLDKAHLKVEKRLESLRKLSLMDQREDA